MRNERQVVSNEEMAAQQADPAYSLKHMSEDTKRVMAKLNSTDSATVGPPPFCMKSGAYAFFLLFFNGRDTGDSSHVKHERWVGRGKQEGMVQRGQEGGVGGQA